MRRATLLALSTFLLIAPAWVAACGGGNSTPSPSGGDDAGGDVTVDSGPETGGDDASDATASDAGDAGSADAPYDGPTGVDGGACSADGGVATVTKIDPVFAWNQASTAITITGSGFVATPKVWLRNSQSGALLTLSHAAYVSSTSITAVVPATTPPIPAGAYDVAVVDPDGCAGWLLKALTIVGNPPPTVLDVSPGTGTTQSDVNVTVTGCDFPTGATLSTIDSTGTPLAQTAGAVTCNGPTNVCPDKTPECTMPGTILTATKTMAPGAYVVRVTNPTDHDWGDWASFVVTTPDGKLTGNWATAPSLNTGRRSLGLVNGRIDLANRFLYAIGGEDANGNALESVEVAPLDEYGQVGAWFTEKNQMNAARSGVAVARQGKYLYAIGGTSSAGGTGGLTPNGVPLGSIERAVILDPADAPVVTDPPATNALDAGGLATGTYYYEVSAVLNASATDNPNGETLPSDEVVANLDAAGNVVLTWTAVANAAYYRVYRSPMANGTSGSEVLLADNVSALTYTDDGSVTTQTETPMKRGSTGVWQTISTTLLHPRFNAAATIAPDPAGNLHLYVLGGWGSCLGVGASAAMNCYEATTITQAGDSIGTPFTPGTNTFVHARQRFGAAAMTAANGPSGFAQQVGANGAFVLLGGGEGIASTGNTVEAALVGTGGVLGTFGAVGGFATERDGSQTQIANGYAYQFLGGTVGHYAATSDLSTNPTFTGPAGGATGMTFGNWSNAGANLGTAIGRHGVALESAYFYVVGGTTNDTDALNTVYQIIY